MQKIFGTLTGKAVKAGLRFRRSGGQALPGLVVESIFPGYLQKMISQLAEGVIIITGTNGKTTTTKIVTEILESQGKQVLTNQTGSNLTRGIVSSVSQKASVTGRLKYDIAVLEVDEAQARRLVDQIKPRWVLGLNVSRDQLDRFGEVDTIADYIGVAMSAATEGIITNARDPNLLSRARAISKENNVNLRLFGASKSLASAFPNDFELAAVKKPVKNRENTEITDTDVVLTGFRENLVKYKIDGKAYERKLKLSGQHNYLNGAAALALCRQLLPDASLDNLLDELSKVSLAFGRGEKYKLKDNAEIELVLVKNPASFTQALASYGAGNNALMIAINDNIADGRDVSWLWDVNLKPLSGQSVAITSGTRAADMALRLSYDDITADNIEPSLSKALELLSGQPGRKVIFATYTAMLQLYRLLSKRGEKLS